MERESITGLPKIYNPHAVEKRLYDWWEQVKDIANEPQRVVIGSNEENPMMLTACDWLDVFRSDRRTSRSKKSCNRNKQ